MSEPEKACLRMFNAVIDCPDAAVPVEAHAEANSLFKEFFTVLSPAAYYAIESIKQHVRSTRMNAKQLNATLYRSFDDVLSRTRLELLIDQLLQYLTINWHGATGVAYVPADFCDLELEIPEKGLEIFHIGAITREELASKCESLLTSGTALKTETVKDALTLLDHINYNINVEEVSNREARAIMIFKEMKSGIANSYRPEEILRATVFASTGTALLIKNRTFIDLIVGSKHDISELFWTYGVDSLASIFNRFKYIFVAYKMANGKNKTVINEISKRSKSQHKPLAVNPLNCVSHRALDLPNDEPWLRNATPSALLRAWNLCSVYRHPLKGFRYQVRNSKCWLVSREQSPRKAAEINYEILKDRIVALLGPKFADKTVFIPKEITYGLPISEKQMLGNIPYGTKITVPSTESIALGLHWKLEDGGQIMDLSGTLNSGTHIAWNRVFKGGPFVHSGDNCAVKEGTGATEYILAQKRSGTQSEKGLSEGDENDVSGEKDVSDENDGGGEKNGSNGDNGDDEILVMVNCWSGSQVHSFQMIVGRGDDVTRQYMMDPANLIVNGRFYASTRMTVLGIIKRSADFTTVTLVPGALGNTRNSSSLSPELRMTAMKAASHTMNYSPTLNELLEILGARVVNELNQDVDFDLSADKINKDFFNLILE